MAIQLVGSTTANSTSGSVDVYLNSLTGGSNSAPVVGDFVLAQLSNSNSEDVSLTITSSGWTEIAELYETETRCYSNASLNYKFMTGSVDPYFTATCSKPYFTVTVQVFRFVDQTTPLDVTPTTSTGKSTTNALNSDITPVTAGALIVLAATTADDDNTLQVTSPPPGASNVVESTHFCENTYSGDGDNYTLSAMSSFVWPGGLVDPSRWTMQSGDSADSWVAFTVALRPGIVQFFVNETTTTTESNVVLQGRNFFITESTSLVETAQVARNLFIDIVETLSLTETVEAIIKWYNVVKNIVTFQNNNTKSNSNWNDTNKS